MLEHGIAKKQRRWTKEGRVRRGTSCGCRSWRLDQVIGGVKAGADGVFVCGCARRVHGRLATVRRYNGGQQRRVLWKRGVRASDGRKG
jgi:hypothetical protein